MLSSIGQAVSCNMKSGAVLALLSSLLVLSGCSSDGPGDNPGNGQGGSQQSTGGANTSGAGASSAGAPSAGSANVAGSGTGGASATGGAGATGGAASAGAPSAGSNSGGAGGSGGKGGAGGGASGGSSGASGAGGSGGGSPGQMSDGCKKTPTLKNSTGSNGMPITISVAGTNREYSIRWPSNYDNTHPYRLILDLHGFGGSYQETAGNNNFGLWTPSNNTTIFVSLSAIDKDWSKGDNKAYAQAVISAVEADLCIDTSRVMLEGFSQGAAEVWQLACTLPGVFRAAVGHSGGGVTAPNSCMPIPYLGSGGLQESVTQSSQTDKFAKWNACTVANLPTAPNGGHVCTNYAGCPATAPVRWCNYDGPHTPLPTDSGKSSSWMPSETWPFFSQF